MPPRRPSDPLRIPSISRRVYFFVPAKARIVLPYIHLGQLHLGTFGIFMWLAFVAAYFVLRA